MKKLYILSFLLLGMFVSTFAQTSNVGIGTNSPNSSAKLDIDVSSDASKSGLLIPRVALTGTTDVTTITSPATSLLVYNTATAGTVPNNVTPGYYYWNGTKWVSFTVNNNNTMDLGYILGWSSNTAPPDYLLPLNGGTYNWSNYPEFQSFHASYPCQFIASSNATTFTLKDINGSGYFLRGNTSAGVNQTASTAAPTGGLTVSTAGAHTHSIDPPSTTTSSNGAHSHTFTRPRGDANWNNGGGNTWWGNTFGITATTSTDGAHTHTLDIAAFTSGSSGSHNHTLSGWDGETKPVNTSVVWCLKVKPTSTSGTINITNTANSAINGLSVYGGGAIGLGGSLNQSTTIIQAGHPFTINNNGAGNTTINLSSTGDFDIQDNGTSAFFVADNGNVGIKNTNPDKLLHIGAGNNDGILIGNYNDQFGWNGTGTPPENSIRFAGYRDVVSNFTGAKIAAIRSNLCCSGLSQSTYLSFQTQSGTATSSGDVNLAEQLKITDKVTVNSLAGTGNRPVYADANGTLKAGSKDIAYSQNRNVFSQDNTNAGWRVIGDATNNLAVETGDIITISQTSKFRWTGGSGGDHPYYGIRITGCATASVTDIEKIGIADDFSRGNWIPIATNYVWVSTCSGNVQFQLYIDNNSDADDNSEVKDIVIIATRH